MSELNELNDDSLMPLGVHKGKRMEEVPASYLIWYRENAKSPNKPLMDYILDNWQVLQKQKNER